MSTIKVDTIQKKNGTQFPLISQVVSVRKTDTFSTTSTSFVDVTDITLNITPTSTSSKILIHFQGFGSNSSGTNFIATRLLRGATEVGSGSGGSSYDVFSFASVSGSYEAVNLGMSFIDSPSTTSETTYKIQARVNAGTGYIGRKGNADSYRMATGLIAMEILA